MFILLINVKMPTIIGILTFMSRNRFHAQLTWAWKKIYNLEAWCLILQSRFGLELFIHCRTPLFVSHLIWFCYYWQRFQYKKGWKLKSKAYLVALWQDKWLSGYDLKLLQAINNPPNELWVQCSPLKQSIGLDQVIRPRYKPVVIKWQFYKEIWENDHFMAIFL